METSETRDTRLVRLINSIIGPDWIIFSGDKKKEEKRRKDGREKKLHTPRRADAMRWWFVAMVVVVVVNEAHRRKRMTFKRTRLYVYQIISVLHDLIDRDGNGARRNLNWFSTHLSL